MSSNKPKPGWMQNLGRKTERAAHKGGIAARQAGAHTDNAVKHRPERERQDDGVFPKPTPEQLAEAARKRVPLYQDWLEERRQRMQGIS